MKHSGRSLFLFFVFHNTMEIKKKKKKLHISTEVNPVVLIVVPPVFQGCETILLVDAPYGMNMNIPVFVFSKGMFEVRDF